MSSAILLSLALQAATPVATTATPANPAAPALPMLAAGGVDWERLTPLPWREAPQLTPDLSRFVRDEIQAQRCAPPKRADGKPQIDVDVAVLTRPDGTVRVTVPRAIDCPSIEQFTAGLVTSFARNNLRVSPEGWYRASVTFALGR